ncbi:CocE/NonD family hydrolase [Streptomyces sp. NPDC060000]|uniref:CocE/NonD family hydrolase n=1 Tax=Streptomyces sp. NPDC060000 TaxID=3347031 RepID=UPI0036D0CEC4
MRWAAALPGSNGSVGMLGASYFGNTQWMAALSKPPELKAIAPMVTWSDPDDGLWTRGGTIELGTTVTWSLLHGAATLMRRHRTDPAALVAGLGGLVRDVDGLAGGRYAELPAGRLPAFARHDLPELGHERSRHEPDWARSCRVAGRHDEVDLPTFQAGGWYDIFSQGTLDNFTAMRPGALFVMGVNQRREETEWPLSRAVDTDFHLRADGRLTVEPPPVAEQVEEFTYAPLDPMPTTGGLSS